MNRAPALRLELWHAGSQTAEGYTLAAAFASAHADPHAVDVPDDNGSYRWTVRDAQGQVLASRGYATFFEEWQSTVVADPAERQARFPETHRVPWHPGARLCIERRRRDGFALLHETVLPATAPDAPAAPARELRVLHGDGGPAARFVVVSEGYAADEAGRFFAQAARARDVLLAISPYAEHAQALQITAVFAAAPASGIPSTPVPGHGATAFASAYGTLDMARYLVSQDLHALHRVLDGLAWDAIIILANAATYGGSGIFHSNACVAAGMDDADFAYVLPHELGHAFGGLGDEYFGKQITYHLSDDDTWMAWEPNVSALDAQGRVKWSDRIDPATPMPTPWHHAAYCALLQADLSPPVQRDRAASLLAAEPALGCVGAFEGARYRATGMYRPEVDCRMFSKSARRFCAVCQQALVQALQRAVQRAS